MTTVTREYFIFFKKPAVPFKVVSAVKKQFNVTRIKLSKNGIMAVVQTSSKLDNFIAKLTGFFKSMQSYLEFVGYGIVLTMGLLEVLGCLIRRDYRSIPRRAGVIAMAYAILKLYPLILEIINDLFGS